MVNPDAEPPQGMLKTERRETLAWEPIIETDMSILVLAPTSNDARLTYEFLDKRRLKAVIISSISDLCSRIDQGCGAVLIAEEVLTDASCKFLASHLDKQPSWSELPIVVITGPGNATRRRGLLSGLEPIGNILIIERPVRPETLVRTFESALRSRRRQYQVRRLLDEREQMIAEARQQSQIFDTTLSSIADFAYIFDRDGRFLYANKSLLDLWGLTLEDAIGRGFSELPYPRELAAKLEQQVHQVVETAHVLRDETAYTNPAGMTGYYEYIFSPVIAADGSVKVVAGSTRDTSERRRYEESLREADRRKNEFLAMLAHELRNPLASVSSAVNLLTDSSESEHHKWAGEVIERQTRQLAHLIDDLLDVSRITSGKIRLRKESVDLAIILDRACDSVSQMMRERNHDFVRSYACGNLWLNADPTRLEQIFLNLLTNSAKYTPAGGLIELSASRDDGDIIVSVRDNGIGIAPERLPEMFQLFAQGERSMARSEGGLGIGLTIVKMLTELHNGRIDAHSEGPNRGSTFTICLPALVSDPLASLSSSAAENPSRMSSKPLRILIVDDNVDTLHGMQRILTRAGHQVTMAHDGAQAVARAREKYHEVILLDIGLPGMDGFKVIRLLRSEPGCASALIIAVTGYGQEEDRQSALKAGFDHHLVKPIDINELKRLLQEAAQRP